MKKLTFLVVVVLVAGAWWWFSRKPSSPERQKQTTPITAATSGVPDSAGETVEIVIEASGFSPSPAKLKEGGTVRFTNRDSVPHQIFSNPHPEHNANAELKTPKLQPGQSAAVTATQKGSNVYHDEADPGHTGVIIVE
ncbi:MAG: cupredoxin domain-containing protein [bacterium]|nr:cupredoxin domain-containing protein [bacterium]